MGRFPENCPTAEWVCLVFLIFSTTAVKVQKSNHHHWDQSSNYCHPPHASHSKTWSSPSHPHNQQDHCKCKLSFVTALLLARHHSRSLFFNLIVESFWFTFPRVYAAMFCSSCTAFSYMKCCVSFQLWSVVASPLPPQPRQASAVRGAIHYPAPSLPLPPPALAAPLARGGTGRRTTRAHVWWQMCPPPFAATFKEWIQ